MEGLMRKIEAEHPELINCFGTIDTNDSRCNNPICKYMFPCHQTKKELRGHEFQKAKYRSDIQ